MHPVKKGNWWLLTILLTGLLTTARADVNIGNWQLSNDDCTHLGLGYMSASLSRLACPDFWAGRQALTATATVTQDSLSQTAVTWSVATVNPQVPLWEMYAFGLGAGILAGCAEQTSSGQPWNWRQFNYCVIGSYIGVRLAW